MPTALFISPHLDDVAFSCGGTLVHLARAGWRVVLVTAFTASVPDPHGFALACQTDKGLGPEVDYMAMRRAEDRQFAQIAGIADVLHLPYAEAPHRGYNAAPELFAGMRADDQIWQVLEPSMRRLETDYAPALIFAPQGIGNHVDHLQVIQALVSAGTADHICWYRDTPYIMRQPDAPPSTMLPRGLREHGVIVDHTLERKIDGCCAYTTQLGFQFGGVEQVAPSLRTLHQQEAQRLGMAGVVEAFLIPPTVDLATQIQQHRELHD